MALPFGQALQILDEVADYPGAYLIVAGDRCRVLAAWALPLFMLTLLGHLDAMLTSEHADYPTLRHRFQSPILSRRERSGSGGQAPTLPGWRGGSPGTITACSCLRTCRSRSRPPARIGRRRVPAACRTGRTGRAVAGGPRRGWHGWSWRGPPTQPGSVADPAAIGSAAASAPAVAYLVEDRSRAGEIKAARASVGQRLGLIAAGHAELMLAELDALQRLIARGAHCWASASAWQSGHCECGPQRVWCRGHAGRGFSSCGPDGEVPESCLPLPASPAPVSSCGRCGRARASSPAISV